jgi:hypothetical protein
MDLVDTQDPRKWRNSMGLEIPKVSEIPKDPRPKTSTKTQRPQDQDPQGLPDSLPLPCPLDPLP